jgi:hypothetical protein
VDAHNHSNAPGVPLTVRFESQHCEDYMQDDEASARNRCNRKPRKVGTMNTNVPRPVNLTTRPTACGRTNP